MLGILCSPQIECHVITLDFKPHIYTDMGTIASLDVVEMCKSNLTLDEAAAMQMTFNCIQMPHASFRLLCISTNPLTSTLLPIWIKWNNYRR